MLNGILTVHKPLGLRSTTCLRKLSSILGKHQKVGHAGTLDSTASGALIVLLGHATRLSETVMNLPKTYRAEIQFGWETDTDDYSGQPLTTPCPASIEEGELRQALLSQFGTRNQRPPRISAVKVQGKRAHELARRGSELQIRPRPVTMTAISELEPLGKGRWAMTVHCHRGTYIRSLARDLGQAIGCGGHIASLHRLAVGAYESCNGISMNQDQTLERHNLKAALLSVSTLAQQYPHVHVDSWIERRLLRGLPQRMTGLPQLNWPARGPHETLAAIGTERLCFGNLIFTEGEAMLMPRINITLAEELP